MGGTELRFRTNYHPQTQVAVEKINSMVRQNLICSITATVSKSSWEQLMLNAEIAIKSSQDSSTGYTPSFFESRFSSCFSYIIVVR